MDVLIEWVSVTQKGYNDAGCHVTSSASTNAEKLNALVSEIIRD
jgi:hypothetical protein